MYEYITNCTCSDAESIDSMVDFAREIKPETFRRQCADAYQEFSIDFGYINQWGKQVVKGLTLANDYTTSFYKSKYRGEPCYYFEHSSIEYVFMELNNE